MNSIVPEQRWHIPLVSFAAEEDVLRTLIESQKPIRQQYIQTIKILSLGEGVGSGELWAHIQSTPGLLAFQESVAAYVQEAGFLVPSQEEPFTPHIRLGEYEKTSSLGIPDSPVQVTCAVNELFLLKNDPYEIIGKISVTP